MQIRLQQGLKFKNGFVSIICLNLLCVWKQHFSQNSETFLLNSVGPQLTHDNTMLVDLLEFVTTWLRNGCVCCNCVCSRVNYTLSVCS